MCLLSEDNSRQYPNKRPRRSHYPNKVMLGKICNKDVCDTESHIKTLLYKGVSAIGVKIIMSFVMNE